MRRDCPLDDWNVRHWHKADIALCTAHVRFETYKAAAPYVDKILKGEKPADLPIDQSSKFEFVVNLKTAKTLGVEMPASILGFASEVIE